jgi:hypothetical protein
VKNSPISELSGAPPETSALSRPPNARADLVAHQPVDDAVEHRRPASAARVDVALAAERERLVEQLGAAAPLARDLPRRCAGASSRRGAAPRS